MTDVSHANDGDTQSKAGGGSGSGSGGGGSSTDKLKGQFDSIRGQAGEKARDMAGQGKEKATGALGDAAKFLEETARTIEEKVGPQYGKYAHDAAGSVSGFAEQLKAKDVDELLEDARALVRKSPAVALGAAVAVGFVVARMVKAGMGYDDDVSGAGDTGAPGRPGTASTGMGGSSASGSGGTGGTATTPGTAGTNTVPGAMPGGSTTQTFPS